MARKKKAQPLTPEEIKTKLKEESLGRWIHSEPLFGLVPNEGGPQFFPISEVVEKETILLFLLDAVDFTTDRVLDILDSWKVRYKSLPWKPVFAFQQKYVFLKGTQFLTRFRAHPVFSTLPIYLDPFGELFEKYGSTKEPVVVTFHQGQFQNSLSLNTDIATRTLELETQLQQTLRRQDAGLPLPLLYQYEMTAPADTQRILPEQLTKTGYWVDGKGSMVTDDQSSSISIGIEGKSVRVVCCLHPQARDNCRIHITLDGNAIPHAMKGEDLLPDEKGMSTIEIDRSSGIFEIIKSPEVIRGVLKIQFSGVIENPVIFYELRVGSA